MTRPHRRANSCCGGAPALAISCLLGLFAPAGAEEFLSAKIAGPQTGALRAEPGLYAARSRDGLRWTALNSSRPILTPGEGPSFDARLVGHPYLLPTDGGIRLWYTGYADSPGATGGWKLRIGLAEIRP